MAKQIYGVLGTRPASKALGDDTTRSRFVRVTAAETGVERHRPLRQAKLPGFENPFVQESRTKFPKSVRAPSKDILVSGHNNIKIGRDVRKGHLRGYRIFYLSLEERKTCPASCQHWQSCYGNNMPFASRVDHTHADFLPELEKAVGVLCKRYRRTGVLIRLHALGDFYSTAYVAFWASMLQRHANLAIYGYTAHPPASDMGWAITERFQGLRANIRFSNGGLGNHDTVTIASVDSCPPHAFVCPEQTGRTLGCDHCALCWATDKTVAFLEH